MNTLQGQVEMTFVMGGISKEKKKPYLQMSNGVEAKFMRLSKKFPVDEDTFSDLEKGDIVALEIETDGVDVVVLGMEPKE